MDGLPRAHRFHVTGPTGARIEFRRIVLGGLSRLAPEERKKRRREYMRAYRRRRKLAQQQHVEEALAGLN